MTNAVEALIALTDRPLGDAEEALIEDLDREIVELDMLVARSGKPAEGDLALLPRNTVRSPTGRAKPETPQRATAISWRCSPGCP